jgi:acetyl-CoA C-acetyltransferase
MSPDGRSPVLIAVGQLTVREGDAPEPVELLAEAARRAEAEAGCRLLRQRDSIRVVNLPSRR